MSITLLNLIMNTSLTSTLLSGATTKSNAARVHFQHIADFKTFLKFLPKWFFALLLCQQSSSEMFLFSYCTRSSLAEAAGVQSRSPDVFCFWLYSKELAVEVSQTLPVAMQCLCPSYSTVKSLRSPVRLTMVPLKNWQTASYSVRRLWAKAGELTVIHWHGSLDVGEWSLLSRRDCWHGGNDTASVSSWLPD